MDIKIENLTKAYNGKIILHDINLTIPKNTCLAIMGESGSGKSTLGRILVGLEEADGGKIYYDDALIQDLTKKKRKTFRKKVQIVFQNAFAAVNPHFTLKRVLTEPFNFINDKKPSKEIIEEKIATILEQVGLDHVEKSQLAQKLSGGQLQRLCIARALITSPEVLILDEALSGLDYLIQKQLLKLLANLKDIRNITYVFIVHDFLLAYYLADRLIIMDQGAIVDDIDLKQNEIKALHAKSKKLLGDFLEKKET